MKSESKSINKRIKFPSKKSFLAWLQKQNSKEIFSFLNTTDCVFARFLKDSGFESVSMGYKFFRANGQDLVTPKWVQEYSDAIYFNGTSTIGGVKGLFLK